MLTIEQQNKNKNHGVVPVEPSCILHIGGVVRPVLQKRKLLICPRKISK